MPVLGYDVDPQGGRIVVNEAEAERVRAIFDLYVEKESLTETLRELNRRRWTTKAWVTKKGKARGGTPFEKNTLFHLLTSPTYVGKVDHRGTVYPGEHDGDRGRGHLGARPDGSCGATAELVDGRSGTSTGRCCGGCSGAHPATLR